MIGKKFKCVNCGVEFFSKEYEKLEEATAGIEPYCNRCREVRSRIELKEAIRDKEKRNIEKLREVV